MKKTNTKKNNNKKGHGIFFTMTLSLLFLQACASVKSSTGYSHTQETKEAPATQLYLNKR